MVFATFSTTIGYILGAKVLGDAIGVLSVAVAWATFYPLAFALLGYIIVKTIHLPLGRYARESWPIIACAALAWALGYAAYLACGSHMLPPIRAVITGTVAMATMLIVLDKWQHVSFRTMKAALSGDSPPPPTPSDPPPP
jgi:hypothetical protein